MEGKVVKSTGKWCQVLTPEQEIVNCVIKGKFRMDGIRSTNPVAVGDNITYKLEEDKDGVIIGIHPRKNYVVRRSVNLSKQLHIIACNVDMCFLLVTQKQPVTSTGFIDRFLISAEAFKVPVTIVFNKVDLIVSEEDQKKMADIIKGYKIAGYPIHEISVHDNIGLDELNALMKNQVTMISGHSGVGKTSLLNAIEPDLELPTMEVSGHHEKGQHTTTFAEMHALNNGGYLIDTPGIKGFGLVDLDKDELGHYFPEMFERLNDCKFHNCRHLTEPKCAVKEAVEAGEIADFRYKNYVNIVTSMTDDHAYRIDPYK